MADYLIRPAEPRDRGAVLALARLMSEEGDAFPWEGSVTDEELAFYWLPNQKLRLETFVAEAKGGRGLAGICVLHPAAGGRGSHGATGAFAVAPGARGRGLGKRLCNYTLEEARRQGYTSVRFGTVVATNVAAVRVCTACGFKIMCTLPRVFQHPHRGLVDAHVMFLDIGGKEADNTSHRFSVASSLSQDLTMRVDEDFVAKLEHVVDAKDLLPEPVKTREYGNWMIWMVHRVWINDPSLEELDFTSMHMPPGHVEKRIAPKLVAAIATNTHLEVLSLSNSNLQRVQGVELASALRTNSTLLELNLECNWLDSTTVRELALAIHANPACQLEHFRVSHQKQMGQFFGRPTEEAIGEMMQHNETIVKLGFECDDAHWRNLIDRALLRNNDYWRKRQQDKVHSAVGEELPPAEDKTLGQLVLQVPPTHTSAGLFPRDSAPHATFCLYVVQNKKLPTTSQLQSCAKNSGTPLSYSVAGPLIRDCRARILDFAVNKEVAVIDAFGTEAKGIFRSWSEVNDQWTVDIWAGEGKRLVFRSNKEPAFSISGTWADWLAGKEVLRRSVRAGAGA